MTCDGIYLCPNIVNSSTPNIVPFFNEKNVLDHSFSHGDFPVVSDS